MKLGVSPVVSYMMVVAIVVTSSMVAYLWAIAIIDEMGEPGRVNSYRNQMVGLDYAIKSVAHGDINFQSTYEMYLPDAFIVLKEDVDSIAFNFDQKAVVLGTPGEIGSTTCNETTEIMYDADTGVSMYHESDYTRVYQGALGPGPGPAEFMLCYYDINLTFGGTCMRGKSGLRTVIYIKKINVTNLKPVVSIDIC